MYVGIMLYLHVCVYRPEAWICNKSIDLIELMFVLAGKKLGCNTGWLPFGSNCYRIVPKQLNWASASQQCSYAGSRLASILSADEQNFIVGNLKKSKYTDELDCH